MPAFDDDTLAKIAALRELYQAGEQIEVFEMVKVEWPAPTGTIYYASQPVDTAASVPPFDDD